MKKILASILAAFFVVLSPISAYAAATTESMMMFSTGSDAPVLRYIPTLDDDVLISSYFSIGDYQLDEFHLQSDTVSTVFPVNTRVDAYSTSYWKPASVSSPTFSIYDNCVKAHYTFTSNNGEALFDNVLGCTLDVHGLFNRFLCYDDQSIVLLNHVFLKSDILKVDYRLGSEDGTRISSGSLNLNDIYNISSNRFGFTFNYPPSDSQPYFGVYSLQLDFYFKLPSFSNYDDVTRIITRMGMFGDDSYFFGDDLLTGSTGSSGQDDYNKNVEAELGNIQTGISNVVNSVVQMGNQAWQGAQQTVQAVTQMTQQLNTAIDQQRQDILNGLGLLGDGIDNTMTNVKTEITNMGSSITNKLESTTESITNKIESTTESITNTIETKVDQVTTAVDNVKESVTEVKQSILDLPNKIKDMLLSLIVPDSQTMADKYSEFSQLLEQKLGVIYQIPMMLFDFFDTIVNAATTPQSTLTLPAFRLPWIDGSQLTIWNSMEYKIIPDGLEVLSDLIRTVTSMTVVVLTFNSVKQAYERFLRS